MPYYLDSNRKEIKIDMPLICHWEYGFPVLQIPGLFEKLCVSNFSLANNETLSDTIITTMVSKIAGESNL